MVETFMNIDRIYLFYGFKHVLGVIVVSVHLVYEFRTVISPISIDTCNGIDTSENKHQVH